MDQEGWRRVGLVVNAGEEGRVVWNREEEEEMEKVIMVGGVHSLGYRTLSQHQWRTPTWSINERVQEEEEEVQSRSSRTKDQVNMKDVHRRSTD